MIRDPRADADPRAIQQIEFKYMLGAKSTIYWVLEKSKETILEFYEGTVKVYQLKQYIING